MTKEERALAAARTLRDFCGEWDCTVCPFLIEDSLLAEDFQCRLSVQSPAYWKIPNKKPSGVTSTGEPAKG
jgi:hypothetical protein